MKRAGLIFTSIIFCGVLAVFFSGCSGASHVPSELSVCVGPDAEGSWICSVVSKYKFTAEDLDSLLLDANTVALISGAYDKEQARGVIANLIGHVENFEMTYTTLIALVLRDTENAGLLAQMVSRHLTLFKNDATIVPFDKQLILTHLRRQLALVGGAA